MAERLNVAIKNYDSDEAWEALKKVLKHSGDPKLKDAFDSDDDEKIEKAIVQNFKNMGENLAIMGQLAHSLIKDRPAVCDAFQQAVDATSLGCHEWLAIMGAEPQVGHDKYVQMWRFPQDEKDIYATVMWMVNTMVENLISQMFPIKGRKGLNQAVYNAYCHLAATTAVDSMRELDDNCDWAGILENKTMIEKSDKHEYIVDGVDCVDGFKPENPYFEMLKRNLRK